MKLVYFQTPTIDEAKFIAFPFDGAQPGLPVLYGYRM